MTNIQDPNSQALSLYSTYNKCNLLKNSLTFVIPVYKNMPYYNKLPHSEIQNGNLYYVSSDYSDVNLRSSPNGAIIGKLRKDTVVTMLQENIKGFGKICCDGKEGYMSMTYLSKLPKEEDTNNKIDDNTINNLINENSNTHYNIQNNEVLYKVHVQDIGWMNWVNDGRIAGTTGQSKRAEAIIINAEDKNLNNNIEYRVHVQDIRLDGVEK